MSDTEKTNGHVNWRQLVTLVVTCATLLAAIFAAHISYPHPGAVRPEELNRIIETLQATNASLSAHMSKPHPEAISEAEFNRFYTLLDGRIKSIETKIDLLDRKISSL